MRRASENASADQVARYADMFSAMGTEPRLRIMQLLLSAHPEGLVVGDIQEELEVPSSTLSHHLDKLKNEGLVNVQRESTFLRYTANTEALQEILGPLRRVRRGDARRNSSPDSQERAAVGRMRGRRARRRSLQEQAGCKRFRTGGTWNLREFTKRLTRGNFLPPQGIDADAIASEVDGKFMGAFIRAVKPAAQLTQAKKTCCGPDCCS
jgi:ArsR family transcriptional regulator